MYDDDLTFRIPKMEVLTYVSSMDTAYVRENPPPLNLVMQNLSTTSTTAKLALAYKKECSSCTLTSVWLVVSTHLKILVKLNHFPK